MDTYRKIATQHDKIVFLINGMEGKISTCVWNAVTGIRPVHAPTDKMKVEQSTEIISLGVMKRRQHKKMDQDSVEEELQKDKLTF